MPTPAKEYPSDYQMLNHQPAPRLSTLEGFRLLDFAQA